jgi:hypothetical protein
MKAFRENWDGIQRNGGNAKKPLPQQPLTEASSMKHFTELSNAAKDIIAVSKTLKGKKNLGGFTPEQAELVTIAHSLAMEDHRMQDFFKGLIFSLEAVHKKAMSPSKHGNMEIMNDLSKVIRELKKYQK